MPTIHATRVGHKDEFKIVRAMPGVSPKDTMMPGRLVPLAMVDNVAAKDRFKEVAAGQSLEMRGTNTATADVAALCPGCPFNAQARSN